VIDAFGSAVGGNLTVLAAVLIAFAAGAMTPVYYAQERFRGFGRAMISKLPYRPPPGTDEQEAMEDATDE
jgi:hypothetical protein